MKIIFKLFLFIFCISNISCNGQDRHKLELKDKSTGKINTIPQESLAPVFYEGQLAHWIREIFEDSKGNLWLGTNHYGVIKYDRDTLIYFNENDGLGKGRITGFLEDKKGGLWIGTASGLTYYNGNVFRNFNKNDGLKEDEVWSIMLDSKENLWIGTIEGIFIYDGEKFNSFEMPSLSVQDTQSILSYNRITAIIEDEKGNIWIGTDGFGICKYDGKNFTHFTKEKDNICDNNIADLLEDSKGNIWIGTMFGGISKYDGKTFHNYTKEGIVKGEEAYAFYEAKNGDIWFAAENQGVYQYNGESFILYAEKDGLESQGILSIFEDKSGHFLLGGWKGLFKFDGESFSTITNKVIHF